MRKIMIFILTLLVLIGLNYGFASVTHTNFVDFAFFIGMIVTIIIWLSGTKGSFISSVVPGYFHMIRPKPEEKAHRFSPNIAFYTSFIYSIVMLIAAIYRYRSYF